ncbi:uncharacterized protein SOCE26_076060 [Sorangium cellulosum]|uniref:Secreted protein n=1 Tax=Sorangium cellulosum TaxID=56 RepID=A0A2L0F3L5_SORCE|nr:hypothetical protein [Sorangium cellulosum]AUX46101.1 uncharacterized protein SOCE26_076060 [Sorangium cellulosum]
MTSITSAHRRRPLIGRGAFAFVTAAALSLGAGCAVAPVDGPVDAEDGAAEENGAAASALTLQQLEQSFVDACDGAIRSSYGPGFTGSCAVSNFTRTAIDAGQNIFEYSADVRVGHSARDVIGLHRVVRESSPFQPAASGDAVMLVHGDAWAFRGAFLDTGHGDTFAAFLAKNGVDVWGIDLGWTRVLPGTSDFSFMSTWGIDKDAKDVGVALSIARVARHRTGSDKLPMKLLGWSRGGQIGYAYLGGESQVPPAARHVNGFIPVDIYLKTDLGTPEGVKQRNDACARLAADLAQYNDPARPDRYYTGIGGLVSTIGQLALGDPETPTPLPIALPGVNDPLSNREVALLVGEATYFLSNPPPTPFYHFTGGTFGADNVPTGLTYVGDEARWFAAAAQAAPFEPLKVLIDAERAMCGDPASTIDAHLSQIAVPVLYVGAEGGFGSSGLYTTTLLASQDRSSIVVSKTADQLHDVGHGDIFLADNARTMFWDGILGWLRSSHHCQDDSECTLLRDNTTCQCLAAPAGATDPKSDSACLVDPCRDKVPSCQNFTCVVSGSDASM